MTPGFSATGGLSKVIITAMTPDGPKTSINSSGSTHGKLVVLSTEATETIGQERVDLSRRAMTTGFAKVEHMLPPDECPQVHLGDDARWFRDPVEGAVPPGAIRQFIVIFRIGNRLSVAITLGRVDTLGATTDDEVLAELAAHAKAIADRLAA